MFLKSLNQISPLLEEDIEVKVHYEGEVNKAKVIGVLLGDQGFEGVCAMVSTNETEFYAELYEKDYGDYLVEITDEQYQKYLDYKD